MRKVPFIIILVLIFASFTFANEKSVVQVNPISFSLITEYTVLRGISSGISKGNAVNLAASVGIDSSEMISLGIKLTSAGIGNLIDGALWMALAYVFLWLMWVEIYPDRAFNSVEGWNIAFMITPVDTSNAGVNFIYYLALADFSLIFGIISLVFGGLLLVPGIILWAVGASNAAKAKLKKEQKIMPVVTGDRIGVVIKF